VANLSYNQIVQTGKCTDYNKYYAGKTPVWIETWQVDGVDYRAIFSDTLNSTLPITITTHEFA
jgi:hypothetical protein